MTEFWVSKSKYYCKICKVWMDDNKMSRQMHDSSGKHRELVDKDAQQKKDAKLQGARSDAELQRTLAEINKAALAAVASDREAGGAAHAAMFGTSHVISGYGSSSWNRGPHPPEGPYPGSGSGSLGLATEKELADALRQDDSGEYTINGVTYREGAHHEDQLYSGVAVEVFVDEIDCWCKGSILSRKTEQIPHTTVVLTSFRVRYAVPAEHIGAVRQLPNVTVPSDKEEGSNRSSSSSGFVSTTESIESKSVAVITEEHQASTNEHSASTTESTASAGVEKTIQVEETKVRSDRMRIVVTGHAVGTRSAAGSETETAISVASTPLPVPAPVSCTSLLSMSADEYIASMQQQQKQRQQLQEEQAVVAAAGGWQTVAVDVVDEAAIAAATAREEEEDQFAGHLRDKRVRGFGGGASAGSGGTSGAGAIHAARSKLAHELAVSLESRDDALSSYDPYGTSRYKGFQLGDDVVSSYGREREREGVMGGGSHPSSSSSGGGDAGGESTAPAVAFKKRKRKGGGSAAATRKTEIEDDSN